MEEEGVGLVLARATELRMKISNCVHKATTNGNDIPFAIKENGFEGSDGTGSQDSEAQEGDAEEDEEPEKLLNICYALRSLETQLSSLQALQQQQQYEREVALAEIEHSRKMLLDKLKEYKGEHVEVIQEASAFAGETVQQNHDLMLPPYPNRPPNSLSLENGYTVQFHSARNSIHNRVITSGPINEVKKELGELCENHLQTGSKNSRNRLVSFIGTAAKTVLTLVGVVTIMSMSGIGPNFVKKDNPSKVLLRLFQQPPNEEKKQNIQCPPGKILVVEDGEARCLVKERTEVPFSSAAIEKPDVNFGCG